ncbi:hypothetical protein CMK15_12080 [Candidatus Poribacteria bacterium]|nr:hypothetical protein [Candidatus Poribacteria bacterium]
MVRIIISYGLTFLFGLLWLGLIAIAFVGFISFLAFRNYIKLSGKQGFKTLVKDPKTGKYVNYD